MPSLIGVVGTTFMAVFITISSAILAPVQCESHPNGYQTVQDYPQIICWSSDYENGDNHTSMVVLSCIASVVPFSFVTVCVWVVMQLPVRMAKGDTAFLHTFSFLFFRFQPSAYWYVLVLLARNLAAATVPIILDEALQLLCLATVLGPCVVVCARALPWRIPVANMLDTTVNMGLLLIVFLAALHAEVLNESLIANMLVVVFVSICTLFALVFLKAVFKAILLRGKKFHFFLCHHKQGGGGFTRLLKCRLKRHPRVRRRVFLDADDLEDLNLLFGHVANDTDTLVVICTSEILARPWCVGEMTTARLHDVDTVLVVLPCFTWPTDNFFTKYASHVPGISELAKFGISVHMAQMTLSWLHSRPRVRLPPKILLSVADAVAGKLVSRKRGRCEYSPQPGVESTSLESPAEHVVQQLEDPKALLSCNAVVIVEQGNWEGVCAALLVRELLVPHLSTALEMVPRVLSKDDSLPPGTACALVLCTNGCFDSVHFSKQVLEAAATGVHFIPVVAEGNFHFPTDAFYEEVRNRAECSAQDLVTAIETIFQEIAIDVVLQEAEDVTAVHVAAIAGRLRETRSIKPLDLETHDVPSSGSPRAKVDSAESSGESWSTVDFTACSAEVLSP